METKKIYVYKYCIVPLCKNTNKATPTKWFFPVPKGDKIRAKWCEVMKRNPAKLSPTSSLLCCEDHFDLENDTVNYMEHKIMSKILGRRVSLRLKKGTLPHKFECQKSCKRPLQKTAAIPSGSKRAGLRDKTFVEHQMLNSKKGGDTVQTSGHSSRKKNEHNPTFQQIATLKKHVGTTPKTASGSQIKKTPTLRQMATLKKQDPVPAAPTTPSGYNFRNKACMYQQKVTSWLDFPSVDVMVTKMVGCAIRNCKSKSVKCSFITFFSFPLDKTVVTEWLKYCGSNTSIDNGRVCSLHFTLADYVQLNPKRLKPSAIPTLNIDSKDVDRSQEIEVGPVDNLIQVKKEYGQMNTVESPFYADGSQAMMLKPERVEQCTKCKQRVKSLYLHICHVEVQPLNVENLVCGACDEYLTTIKNFVVHVLSSHAASVESMFFPNSAEFINWKSEMEAQTHTRYIVYERSDNKKFYHCDYSNEIDKLSSHICPSILVVQEFSKGIQVHYYKIHHKHNNVAYSLSNKFKKYSISSFLQENNTDNEKPTNDKDLYLEFKNVMKGIMVDAAKINIATLKILLDMALEMASIVTSYDEDKEEHELNNHHMTDDQITEALEIKASGKRKKDNPTGLKVKRPKLVVEKKADLAPKIVNTFSLASDANINEEVSVEVKKEVEDTEDVKDAEDVKEDERDPYSSAFNDSYKDFVVKNFSVPIEGKQRLKRQVVKTKIGQFKPVTPPKIEEITKIERDKLKLKADKPKVVERRKPKANLKGIVKNLSPRLSLEKPIEPEYEVKEQEGDCNILILKI